MAKIADYGFIIIIFILGLYFCTHYTSQDIREGFSANDCPNLLIKKGNKYFLRNTKKAAVPGVNPLQFDSLEEYVEFTEWQRGQGIRCPVLFAQETNDAQGGTSIRFHPDVIDTNSGLPSQIQDPALQPMNELETKLYDANRGQQFYNKGSMPAYDPKGQYIGADTPLDKMFNESSGGASANAMASTWGGVEFSRNVVDSGAYIKNTRAKTLGDLQPNKVRGELLKTGTN